MASNDPILAGAGIEGNLDDFEDEIFDERTKSAEAKKLIS
jgi:hypothetical protein